jgi:hypothetical protein
MFYPITSDNIKGCEKYVLPTNLKTYYDEKIYIHLSHIQKPTLEDQENGFTTFQLNDQ